MSERDAIPEMSSADAAPPSEATARGLRWWLRAIEVRLRFVLLVLAIVGIMTQWQRLRATWDSWSHSWWGAPADTVVSGDLEFFCPMDPGVISIWPAVCPICNMDLVPRQPHDAQLLPEGVIARMQLSPYRVQLAGIKTATVESRDCVLEIPVEGVLELTSSSGDEAAELAFTAPLSRTDEPLLASPRDAVVWSGDAMDQRPAIAELLRSDGDAPPRIIVRIPAAARWTAGMTVNGLIRLPLSEPSQPLPVVPKSAVVDHGFQQLVFVESMPGTFDAVIVQLGRRCGDVYPVRAGLAPGVKIAAVGAFLIDAETRLNSSVAVTYFGANQETAQARAPRVQLATPTAANTLSPEDALLAQRQGTCPVTDLPLDSMGGPVPMDINGRRVFLCCKGCEGKLKQDPAKYLAKLPQP